ncbi:MAG: hypothetical protein ACOCU6_02320 [Nanoarchaeota archaeon]
MDVKHNHNCQLCNSQKTCFIFSDFTMLFSICRSCFDQLATEYPMFESGFDICSFCEKEKEIKTITGFDNAMFFTDLRMCKDCFEAIKTPILKSDN